MQNRAVDEKLYHSYGDEVPDFLKRIYAARGVLPSECELSLQQLLPPDDLVSERALEVLERALVAQKNILIIGDFDADGATASAVMVRALRALGAKFVDFLVPNRFEYGYGLSVEIVDFAHREKSPDLIITVDNGISSVAGTKRARELGIQVIITDHHLPGEKLPAANAIVNPNLPDCDFSSKNLAGVGVGFYLLAKFKTRLAENRYFARRKIPEPDFRDLLDLVALGTVADMVKLDYNNRILVDAGLRKIRCKNCCVGILALLKEANIRPENIQAEDFGFALAPRLNAAGRLQDISRGVHCLLSDEPQNAARLAAELSALNQERKTVQAEMEKSALKIVENHHFSAGNGGQNFTICLFDSKWHEGVVGLVAGKLKEKYHRPCVVFAPGKSALKGSARSVAGVHIKDLFDQMNRDYPDLIQKFGGHAQAAGLSIKKENFQTFADIFEKTVKAHLNGRLPSAELWTDGDLHDSQMTLENALLIAQKTPWGQGFEAPVFCGEFELQHEEVVGGSHLRCRLKPKKSERILPAIGFFQPPVGCKSVAIVYKLSVNYWQNEPRLQLLIQKIEAIHSAVGVK